MIGNINPARFGEVSTPRSSYSQYSLEDCIDPMSKNDEGVMDRKQESACPVDEPVRVNSLDAPLTVSVGRIQNISDTGMRLALNDPFPMGSRIELKSNDWVLSGTVIDCSNKRNTDACHWIGIRIEHVTW
jgi:PilZ domain